jgi:hypothetical protein
MSKTKIKINARSKQYIHIVYCLLIVNIVLWGFFALPKVKEFHADYTSIEVRAANEEVSVEAGASSPKLGSKEWIREEWENTGASWEEVWAVTQLESSWNPENWNCNTNGSLDMGLYQLNTVHDHIKPSCAFNAICATYKAIELYKEQGWTPWVAAAKLNL